MIRYFVEYKVGPPVKDDVTSHTAGPYASLSEADMHKADIAGYQGVSHCWIREETELAGTLKIMLDA